MGRILKSFFIGFFTVFFAKTLYYKQRDQHREHMRLLDEINRKLK